MKEPSPLVPQGTFESQARRKSHVRIAVFSILAVHVVVLGGLLILGCKREDKDKETSLTPSATNEVPFTGTTDVVNTNPSALPTNVVSIPPIPTNQTTIVNPPPDTLIEHTIVKGDNFATLATKYGVSAKAIQDANPTLVPTKLKIGDKVKIPPKAAPVARAGNGTTTTGNGDTYTVKSGDTLSKIASDHKTTVKKLQELNNLTTTQIKVGQKLKVPPGAATAPTGTPPPAQ